MNITFLLHWLNHRMPVALHIHPLQHHIRQMPLPPTPPLISRRPSESPCSQPSVDPDPASYTREARHRAPAPRHTLSQAPAEPPPRNKDHATRRRLQVQAQRSSHRRICLRSRNLPVRQHLAEYQIPPPQHPIRILQRRISLRPLWQRRQQSCLRQRQILHLLIEVKLRPRFKPVSPMPR